MSVLDDAADVASGLLQEAQLYEARFTQGLQEWIDKNSLDETLVRASRALDPGLAFSLYFPVLAGISWAVGARFLGAVVVCEWANMILKWVLRGDRPYWWIQEGARSIPMGAGETLPKLKQNALTCETGPGSPSGHVMIATVIWAGVFDGLVSNLIEKKLGPESILAGVFKRAVQRFFVFVLIPALFVSRVYNLNHFPHQCVLAILAGQIIVRTFYSRKAFEKFASSASVLKAVAVAIFLLASSLAIHTALVKVGMNPDWSIARAVKHCQKKSWISIDTRPFYAMIRFSGSAMGLALATSLAKRTAGEADLGFPDQIFRMVMGFLVGHAARLAHKLIPPDMAAFYPAEFALNAAAVLVVLVVIPWLSGFGFWNRPDVAKTKKEN